MTQQEAQWPKLTAEAATSEASLTLNFSICVTGGLCLCIKSNSQLLIERIAKGVSGPTSILSPCSRLAHQTRQSEFTWLNELRLINDTLAAIRWTADESQMLMWFLKEFIICKCCDEMTVSTWPDKHEVRGFCSRLAHWEVRREVMVKAVMLFVPLAVCGVQYYTI